MVAGPPACRGRYRRRVIKTAALTLALATLVAGCDSTPADDSPPTSPPAADADTMAG